MSDIKRVAAINDLSGYGKCSLTVALPILSCMGVEACPLPTAVLSAHTGYPDPVFVDFSAYMRDFLRYWKRLGIRFDTVYTGFLGSLEQIEIIAEFIDDYGKDSLILVDPVMGDNGVLYPTYTAEMCESMKHLVERADVITPNLTEAAFLLGLPYSSNISKPDLLEMAKALSALGPKKTVITGCICGDKISNVFYDAVTGCAELASAPYLDANYSGTGDIFSSIICASLLNGQTLGDAVNCATLFVHDIIAETKRRGGPNICFEHLIAKLARGDYYKS